MTETYIGQMALKLDILDDKVTRKAKELYKQIGSQKTLNCSESCKAVVCLELANTLIGNEIFKKEMGIKISGCKKSNYLNMLNIISKILNLDKIFSVRELCLNFGLLEMESSANNLLEKYSSSKLLTKEDLEHPMYSCAAILATCRLNKIKVKNDKLVEYSRLKKVELEELADSIEKFGERIESKRKRPSNQSKDIAVIANDSPTIKKGNKKTEEELENEYQQWKKKMLAE